MAIATHDPRVETRSPTAREALAEGELGTSPSLLKRVSWGAIFAGAAVASVLAIWFNMLGMAIGLAVYEPLAQQAAGFGIGALLWVLGTAIVSLFCGGWVAGRLTGSPRRLDRALHGIVVWSVATLFGLYVLTQGATQAASGTASVLGGLSGAAAPALGAALQQADLPPEVSQELEGLIADARTDPQLRASVLGVITGTATTQERERLVQELSSRSGTSPAQIEQRLASWEQQAQQAKQQLAQAADKSAAALSAAAFTGVAAMLLGLGAGGLGAASASPASRRREAAPRYRRDEPRRS